MKRGLIIAACLGLAVCLAILAIRPSAPERQPSIPVPDLAAAHPQVAEAIRTSIAAVREQPQSAEAWGEYGTLLLAHDYRPQATACLVRAAELDPSEFRWPYFLGFLQETTEYEAAARHYSAALEIDPEYVPARIRIARIQARLGRIAEAERHLELAIRTAPDHPQLLLERARFAIAARDYAPARRLLERALTLRGWYPREAYLELARVCSLLEDTRASLLAQQAASRLPDGGTSEIPDPVLAEAQMREVLSRDLAQQADRLMAMGQWDQAVAAFEELARKRPDFPRARINLAQCLQMQGDLERSLEVLRELCREFPGDVTSRFSLAMALEQAGREDEALASYRRAIEIKPDHAAAYFNVGLIFERGGAAPEAVESYRAAVESNPQHAPAHLALGVLLRKTGASAEEYVPHLEAAVRLAPGDPVPRQILDEALSDSESAAEHQQAGP